MSAATKSAKTEVPQPVPQPNEKAWKDKIAAENRQIELLRAEITALSAKIGESSRGKEEFDRKRAEIRSTVDGFQATIEELEQERKALFSHIDDSNKKEQELRTNAFNLKKSIGFTSEDEIDKKINEIAHMMQTSTLSLKDEKQMMAKIQQLKNSKPLVGQYSKMDLSASTFADGSVLPMRARLDEIRTKLASLREQKNEAIGRQNKLIEERSKVTQPVRELWEKKNTLVKQVESHITTCNELNRTYNAELRKYEQYMQAMRSIRAKKSKEEEKRRMLENEKLQLEKQLEKIEETGVSPHVQLLQQMTTYLNKLEASREDEKGATVVPQAKPTSEEGALVKKTEREEEYFFAPKKKSVLKSKQAFKQKPKQLKHDLATLSYFQQAGIEAPISLSDIQKTRDQISAKLADLEAKQQLKVSEKEDRRIAIRAKLDALEEKIREEIRASNVSAES